MGFDEAIRKVLKWEGGFVDDPDDHGGATNYGITQATLSGWRRTQVSRDDVLNLRPEEAIQIYKVRYWDANRVDELPSELRGVYFDVCVNAGGGRACRLLQSAINALGGSVIVDGAIGPRTLAASRVPGIAEEFTRQRIGFYHRIVERDPSQRKFLQGWLNRAEDWR